MSTGNILVEEAYARGKMLDHSGWKGRLPRGITPSDIDASIDNRGNILLWEFNSRTPEWANLSAGQRILYENLVAAGKGKIVAVCAHHSVPPPGIPIDTRRDVVAFQWMRYRQGFVITSQVWQASYWPVFVEHFCRTGV